MRILGVILMTIGILMSIATPVGIVVTIAGLLMWNKEHIKEKVFPRGAIIGACIIMAVSIYFYAMGSRSDSSSIAETVPDEKAAEVIEATDDPPIKEESESETLEKSTPEPEPEKVEEIKDDDLQEKESPVSDGDEFLSEEDIEKAIAEESIPEETETDDSADNNEESAYSSMSKEDKITLS